VVSAEDAEGLVAVPESWVGKSRVAHLGYETVLERVAEQYHASENAVRRLNPQASWPHPRPGTPLVVPNPYPHRKGKAARLVIQIVHQRVVAYGADGGVLAWFPCSIGGRVEKRPAGELQVVNCAENPDYVFDPALFVEDPEANSIRGKLFIPPGPNNPVGVAWIGLSLPGYGIHGTPKPQDIGKTQSHGCFRLANWNARKLLGMIQIGMPVKMDWTE
jgi:lipoprotein-anchoring transpeptidase ErfK/SrfK